MQDVYQSPLVSRYATREMLKLFSPHRRTLTWRKLWVALARAEMALGMPITSEQVDELIANIDNIDEAAIAQKEKEIRHDVMAHIYGFGLVCPKAKGIIHLGATSCYVTDNADILIYNEALNLLKKKLLTLIGRLSGFAEKYSSLPTLGYTHFQIAQPVTVGKRACLWMQDYIMDLEELLFTKDNLLMLGSKGTTGTQASFLSLFNGDHSKVLRLDEMIAHEFGMKGSYPITGQTYPRKVDSRILNTLSSIAQSSYRFATDLRLLQHLHEVEEPFEMSQVGSSAMAYKRNPMRSERVCALARYVIVNSQNGALTASSQWLERTLDDSANRRISLPESFLAVDAILNLLINISSNLKVYPAVIKKNLNAQMPFIATENLLMEAVKRGGDRQLIHEIIRVHSMQALEQMKEEGADNNLIERLACDDRLPLTYDEILKLLEPICYVGRAPEQVNDFLTHTIQPLLESHGEFKIKDELTV